MSFFERLKKIAEETTTDISDKAQQTVISFGDQLKQTEKIKPLLINQVVAIDYDMVLNSINALDIVKKDLLIDSITCLKEASEEFNKSESLNRSEDFLQNLVGKINGERVVKELEPIVTLIPMGALILMVLKLFIAYNK